MLVFPIIVIGFMSNIIAQATVSYQRILEVLDAPLDTISGTLEKKLDGKVGLKNICLEYGGKPVLKNVSFTVGPGSQTAILGPTAAGKSQLFYLMTGLNAPDSGSIEFDGKDIGDYDKESLHSQIGFVFQDSILFNMSIRENIAYGKNTSEESLDKAIRTAELADFVENLPNKLETMVSERGTSLSGGQKQRIMLARALAMEPKILLLDDFTARVDRQTERIILCNIAQNYPGLTLVSITQKISAIKDFGLIVLLMEGEVVAAGKHEELLATCPEYVQIFNSQLSTSHYEL